MGHVVRHVGVYTLNQVDYPQRGGYDIVCQVKKDNIEICHCTWHPDGAIHCKDRYNSNISEYNCPCYRDRECLRT